jgi:hypothetical protein
MTVHTSMDTGQPDATPTQPPSLTRLRMRETALRNEAAQLQARADHLERVAYAQSQQLKRRVDAHEKIVLGALAKRAGLDFPLHHAPDNAEHRPNDGNALLRRKGIANQSVAYDQAFILGAMKWLAFVLSQSADEGLTVPDKQQLRRDGQFALERRC